jgi:sarcosine oxidase
MPIYIWDMQPYGNFYGFPEQAPYEQMIKIALHYPGRVALPGQEQPLDISEYLKCQSPATVDRTVHDVEKLFMREMFRQKMPLLDGELLHTETCMYTMTPDEHL